MKKPKRHRWVECCVCGALVYGDDKLCCVCHSPLKGNMREPTEIIALPAAH